jgi:predicted transcriptional regulator
MVGKGLIARDETRYPQSYAAVRSEEETQRLLATDLIDRAFRGSAHKLIMQALSEHNASEEELLAIRRLLEDYSGH